MKTRFKEMSDQMQGRLAWMDDPWGISWRVKNMIKRFDWRRSCRLIGALLRGVHYERPVFVLGVPQSGTSMLFQLLRSSEELASLPKEGHDQRGGQEHRAFTTSSQHCVSGTGR